ncbi:hypothetical protein Patl1_14356 [Pistacia atlantica]|uniref:Uncharacterized protein n=1 Tax=Pistacia atlantica TaxID=434234 RepID=A0ACC1ATR6_9ROSI|nr:hypothetical protein Patl1_14356 [Pistacia atlantica]
MGRNDIARQYCSMINNNPNHLLCKFCGHSMRGITRFKEHLAQKRGDVLPCSSCPIEVSNAMKEQLIQLSFKREEKEKRTREALQRSITTPPYPPPPPPPPPPLSPPLPPTPVGECQPLLMAGDVEAKEKAVLEFALQESLKSFEMERKIRATEEVDVDEFEAACRESMRTYKVELWRRGEGPSNANYYESADVETEYDSDFSF